MKLITEPEVYLLGKQVVVEEELKRFLADNDTVAWTTDSPCDAETLVELGARTCYQSWKGGRPHDEHLKHLIEVGHGSCIEHAVWNLLVTGVSRSLTHELVRHRAGLSPSQLSQRFVDESDCEFVVPPLYKRALAAYRHYHADFEDPAAHCFKDENGRDVPTDEYVRLANIGKAWVSAVQQAQASYQKLAEFTMQQLVDQSLPATDRRKIARQAARSVLPNATETKVFCTLNARAARNILEQRCSRHADTEIRILAMKIYNVLSKEAPNLFSDYEKRPLPDGTFELVTNHRKV